MDDLLKPPSWLDRRGKEYYKHVAPMLLEMGTLNLATQTLLATSANAYSTYRSALDHLIEEGRVIATKGGAVKANPWTMIEDRAFAQMCRVHKLLSAGPVPTSDDDLDAFIKG